MDLPVCLFDHGRWPGTPVGSRKKIKIVYLLVFLFDHVFWGSGHCHRHSMACAGVILHSRVANEVDGTVFIDRSSNCLCWFFSSGVYM